MIKFKTFCKLLYHNPTICDWVMSTNHFLHGLMLSNMWLETIKVCQWSLAIWKQTLGRSIVEIYLIPKLYYYIIFITSLTLHIQTKKCMDGGNKKKCQNLILFFFLGRSKCRIIGPVIRLIKKYWSELQFFSNIWHCPCTSIPERQY